jgi:ribosomal protein L11 methyltransferase
VPVELVLEVEGGDAGALSDRLLELGAAVSIEDAAAGTAGERPLFDEPGSDPRSWPRMRVRVLGETEDSVRLLLEAACRDVGVAQPAALSVERVDDRDWVAATQAQFPPIRVSQRLWIVPSWRQPPDPAAISVILDPGRAFGTGSHPTTLLCLEWLEHEIHGGESVLDYGCGSGILAIAAAKLGAGRVVGVDIDAQALLTARDNAASNGVSCEFLAAESRVDIQADVVLANILANPLLLLAPALAGLTRERGRIVLAGLLGDQFDEVARAYSPWFDVDAPVERDGWARLSGTRREMPR